MAKVSSTWVVVFLWVACALVPVAAAAQEGGGTPASVLESWPGLNPERLETVYVVDDSGVETAGKLLALTPDALHLWQDGAERRIARGAVVRVQKRDSLRNGVIAGAIVGTVLGVIAAGIADCDSRRESSCFAPRLGLAALSAVTYTGMGVGIDALIQGRTTVYTREPRRQTSVTVSASPSQASLGFGVRW